MHPSPVRPHSTQVTATSLATARMNALLRANRNLARTAPPSPAADPTPKPVTVPPPRLSSIASPGPILSAKPAPAPVAKPDPLTAPLPHIAGLNASQTRNAWEVVLEGHTMGISQRGQIIAMATALQESQLFNYTHAVDHDSLGIFQQRPSMGWGTRSEITNPLYAARAFYRVLMRYQHSWNCLTCAAQDVQRSAFPGAYAKHERFATQIVQILNRRF